ncbi:MAG TPA: co-chaperone GroES family protein [Gemmatimonadota bacterium]|jgi:co-chaperonin GroES (HSP10)
MDDSETLPGAIEGGKRLIVMGDRVLVSPDEGDERTEVGLYLPRSVMDRENVQAGRVVAKGPGIPLADPASTDVEAWQEERREPRHLPMQVEVGDYAIFLRKAAVEIKFEGRKFLVVPQSALLLLVREAEHEPEG